MPEPHTAAIALGSNLPSDQGSPRRNLHSAIERIGALGRVTAISRFLVTAPEMYRDQPDFLNAALLLETALEPLDLLRALLAIELAMGRVRTGVPAKGTRIIDLDLVLFDEVVMTSAELTLPHPGLAERRFVLEPLSQIAPEWVHPATGETVAEMLRGLANPRLA
jgi:2-amino-4-hydroxy-6-hydroxymethyldihydropteridine diphosphokinase